MVLDSWLIYEDCEDCDQVLRQFTVHVVAVNASSSVANRRNWVSGITDGVMPIFGG
jgi:hypothetical protein